MRENLSSGFSTSFDTNRSVQPQKMARNWEFLIWVVEDSVQICDFCILKIPCDVIFCATIPKTFVCIILCLKSVIRLPYVLTEIESLQTDYT